MKIVTLTVLLAASWASHAQTRVSPVIKTTGAIYDIPFAEERPDPEMDYKIVIDVNSGSPKPRMLNPALERVARLINLHAVGGVKRENLHVVAVIHSDATYTIMNNEAYKARFDTDNPNLALVEELLQNDVKIFVCGQSLIGREVDHRTLIPGVTIALSMLTTVTTYQLNGYAVLEF
ncbi:MAG: DsrE family protein [Bacteroidia bacterium]|nr:DsrE family protein [Bacteroidia bacterium]